MKKLFDQFSLAGVRQRRSSARIPGGLLQGWQKYWLLVGLTSCGLTVAPIWWGPPPVIAHMTAQLSSGRVAFVAQPRLEQAYATRDRTGESRPTYYLTFQLPEGAAVPLSQLTVELSEGRRDPLFRYRLEATAAFLGTPGQRGESVALAGVTQNQEQKSVTLNFEPAIAPGQTVTIGLKPERNPRFPGTYLFRVTGYPVGDQAAPSFMGYARLSFYDADRRWPIFR